LQRDQGRAEGHQQGEEPEGARAPSPQERLGLNPSPPGRSKGGAAHRFQRPVRPAAIM
jgi:hypothetical protein